MVAVCVYAFSLEHTVLTSHIIGKHYTALHSLLVMEL
jgi:hypothetical protein